ncbi:MAG: ABC transporter permease [Acidimicrobiales bacterium]
MTDVLAISFKSIWGHRRRLVGTTVAVVLGVAFLVGTLVLGDTLGANFDRLFTEVTASTDVVVRNATEVSEEDGHDAGGPIPASVLDTVRDVDGVAVAEPQVLGYGSLIGSDGEPIGGNGPPRQAGSWITDTELNPYRLVDGRAPQTDAEVVVNRGAAIDGGLGVGDTAELQTPEPIEVTIVGLATFGDTDGLGQTTFTAFTLEGAQRFVARQPDVVTTVMVRAEPGVAQDELVERIARVLPVGVEAITGDRLTDERIDEIGSTFLDGLRAALVVFAGIALVVAAFGIHNTFAITVAQRTRELALLRAVGASRRQVLGSVAIEAVAVGAVASAVGTAAGLGIAGLLKGMFDAFGFALPAGGLTVLGSSLAVGFAAGVLVTLVAALTPARSASRIAPMAALRETAAEPRGIGRIRPVVGIALAAGGVAATLFAASGEEFIVVAAVGAAAIVGGVVALAPVVVAPAVGLLGAPLARLRGVTGVLARQNARRNPRRSASTSTALVIGVAVVALFTVFTASLRATLDDDVSAAFGGDLVIGTPAFGGGGLSPQLVDELGSRPEVDQAVGLGGGLALVDGDSTTVTATDLNELGSVVELGLVDGDLAEVGPDGVAVSETRADDEAWSIGSQVEATFVDGGTERLTVRAIYEPTDLLGGMTIPGEVWAAHTPQAVDRAVLVALSEGVSIGAGRQAIEPLADRYGGDVQDRDEYVAANTEGLDLLLNIIYVMLALAIFIALLGIANTLSLAVYERRRELGLLRAVGQTQRQARSMIRWESVILSSFGTLVGLAVGSFIGWVLFMAVTGSDDGTFALPVPQLAVAAGLGALAGMAAAFRPARRAARLPILNALAAE